LEDNRLASFVVTAFLTAEHHPACYPSDPAKVLAFFRDALALPTGATPPIPATSQLAGIIAPHIDFRVSLRAYAAAFRPLLDDLPLADTYIILGVGHRSHLEWNLDRRDYVTPLGRAVCATEWVDALTVGTAPPRHFSPEAHVGEHSIEFPLVWLQALHQLSQNGKPIRFVPLLCGGMHEYVEGVAEWDDLADFHRLSRALGTLLADNSSGRVHVIVSIDGCHLGPRFQHPFRVTPALLKATAGWEEMLWACAAKGDARAFLDWFREEGNDRYFDGVGALALLMNAGKFGLQRTYYEQWFTERDASAVTFSSGLVLA
jgi:AmmeMemoRadiSam system protein B